MCHYWFWRVCWESTCLAHTIYCLWARHGAHSLGFPQGMLSFWCSDWLKLLGWLSAQSPLLICLSLKCSPKITCMMWSQLCGVKLSSVDKVVWCCCVSGVECCLQRKQVSERVHIFNGPASVCRKREGWREGEMGGRGEGGKDGGRGWVGEVSKLVFYAQSTSAVISGRCGGKGERS